MTRVALLASVMLGSAPAHATDVVVRVLNLADGSGSLRVEICRRAEWLNGCDLSAAVAAREGLAVVRDVPPGEYGVIAHHDSNDDGEVNRNLLGIPTEGVGFSRDAPFRFGPPRFADAVLRIEGRQAVVDITLHFERAHP